MSTKHQSHTPFVSLVRKLMLVGFVVIIACAVMEPVECRLPFRPPPGAHVINRKDMIDVTKVKVGEQIHQVEEQARKDIDLYLQDLFENINRNNRPRYGRSVPLTVAMSMKHGMGETV